MNVFRREQRFPIPLPSFFSLNISVSCGKVPNTKNLYEAQSRKHQQGNTWARHHQAASSAPGLPGHTQGHASLRTGDCRGFLTTTGSSKARHHEGHQTRSPPHHVFQRQLPLPGRHAQLAQGQPALHTLGMNLTSGARFFFRKSTKTSSKLVILIMLQVALLRSASAHGQP